MNVKKLNNISIIGIGKLGLCFALTLEKAGYKILGLDVNEEYIKLVNNKTLKSSEKNVENFLKKSSNFTATLDLKLTIDHANIIFVIVPTPSLENGEYDHKQIDILINNLIQLGTQKEKKHLIISSTTMPEYCDSIQEKLKNYNYIVSYNPEFIAQGSILKNQMFPDIVLIGEGSIEAGDIIEKIYLKHTINHPKIHRMSRTEAEICKISLNCFLTTKIAYANMIGDIAIRSKCNPDKILSAIGDDSRIGSKYLNYGYGFGGPCFPRDNIALSIFASYKNINAVISKASDESNNLHLDYQIIDFINKNPNKNIEITIDSVSYKKGTNILQESQKLKFALKLYNLGYKILIIETKEIIKILKNKYGDIFKYRNII